jgi:hypothetical protein
MPFAANTFRVAIASPSDVREERRIVREVVHDWNAAHAMTRGVVLLPVGWEKDTTSQLGARAQALINEQIIQSADLLIAVFWSRLGTPTGEAPSGTVEEIRLFLAAGKPVLIYFSSAPLVQGSVDIAQYQALLTFRRWCEQNGLVGSYDTVLELREKLSRELALLVNTHSAFGALPARQEQQPTTGDTVHIEGTVTTDPINALSPHARDLLAEASRDKTGTLLAVSTLEGFTVETNGKSFVPEGDPRSAAAFREAIDELLQLEFLRAVGKRGEVFEVTHAGYAAGDRILAAAFL